MIVVLLRAENQQLLCYGLPQLILFLNPVLHYILVHMYRAPLRVSEPVYKAQTLIYKV